MQEKHYFQNDQTHMSDGAIFSLPQVVLIKDQQWTYVKRRYNMTNRELEIAKLVCRGLVNEEIADQLKIRHGTVKTHIRNIYRKTWVHNKIAMLLRFIDDLNNVSYYSTSP